MPSASHETLIQTRSVVNNFCLAAEPPTGGFFMHDASLLWILSSLADNN